MSLIFDKDTLELSSRFSTDRKIIDAQSDLHLTHKGQDVLGFKNKELFSLSMK